MMLGPSNTPYEDGLFFFDMHLPNDYPNTPPHVHYVSFCSDKLNPNLYVDGKVCVSLLGTWIGKVSVNTCFKLEQNTTTTKCSKHSLLHLRIMSLYSSDFEKFY